MTDSSGEIDSARGWLVVILGVLALLLVWGTIFTFTVYAQALAEAFDLSSLRVSSVFSITTAMFFVAGGTAGVLTARLPLRPVVAGAGLTFAAAIGLLQVNNSYPGLVAAFGLIGLAGGTVFVVVISLVPQWFDEYRGRAMGVAMTGNGLGVLVLPFAWVWLLGRVDVQTAFLAVGGATAGAVLLASLFYRRPADLAPAGDGGVDLSWLWPMLRERRFVVALVGYPLIWSWYFVLSSSLVDVLTTAGIVRTVAATAFGTLGGISVVTRLASGTVADWIGARVTLLAGVSMAALGVLLLPITETPTLMYVVLAVFGVGLGAVATLFSPVILDRFGQENATAIVGLFTVMETTTAFGAPLGMNLLVTATGGYTVPLVTLSAVTFAGALLFHWGTAPSRESDESAGGSVSP